MVTKFDLPNLPRVKAVVVWGEKELSANLKGGNIILWNEFMALGKDIKDTVVREKALK